MKHLKQNLSGVENMSALPDAMFVIDSNAEAIAVREARRMGVPVVSIVDTNCDPDQVDWVIPGNDDALRAIKLFTSKISDAVIEGRHAYERSQIAQEKAATDAATGGEDVVEYQDTSKYESYEKQEGDFVEPTAEPFAETVPETELEPEPNNSVKGAAE
jgi:small subunit ribosomal protein S2